MISLIIIGLFGAGWQLGSGAVSAALIVPLPAAILAGAAALLSFFAYVWAARKLLWWLALLAYLMLSATTAIVVVWTGGIESPFLALWMLLSVFSGLFGYFGLVPIFFVAHLYLAYLLFLQVGGISRDQIVIFVLAIELPLAVSYLLWHNKSSHENDKDKAFDALAKELNQVANKSEIVINSIADGVLALDGHGTIQLINPAAQALMGWGKQDAMGLDYRSVFKLIDSSGKEVIGEFNPLQQVLHTNQSLVNNDLTLTTQSGKQLAVSLLVSPISTTAGGGVIVVFRDITTEKAEERQQAEFISTASHEMRTPVAAIEGYIGLALNVNTAVIDEKARSYLLKAHEASQHLGHLFQDLLDVSKAEDGRLNTKPIVVDVVDFARNITNSLALKAKEKQLFLYFKPDGGTSSESGNRIISPVFYAKADVDHLREILSNLVDNAIKYTKKGNVTIDVVGDDKQVTIEISDTGIGIPREDLPHLFQKFYRVDNSDTREIGGTGLGLYLCRQLAETMNGNIRVNSEYGKGSTFYLDLPRVSHEVAMDALEQQAEAAPPVIDNHSAQPTLSNAPEPVQMASVPVIDPMLAPQTPAPPQAPREPVSLNIPTRNS